MKKLFGVFIVLFLGFFALIASPPLKHMYNFIVWGPHSLDDYKTQPFNLIEKASVPQPWEQDVNYNKIEMDEAMLSAIDSNHTRAYLVFKDGKLLYERYFGTFKKEDISNSFSAAKSIVSLLIGKAIEEGKIKSVDQKVREFIPAYGDGEKAQVSIKDLLTMSSGSSWDESDKAYFSFNAKTYYADDLDYLAEALDQKEPSGKTWEYRSGDTQVLGLILEKVFGQSISTLTKKYFYDPMGFEYDAKWLTDGQKDHEKSFCCYHAPARDYGRFGALMLNDGKWKDKQIIEAKYMADATKAASFLKDPTENNAAVDFYGYQYWVFNHGGRQIPCMNGLWGQYVFAIKDKNMVVVRLGQSSIQPFKHHYQPDMALYVDAALSLVD